VASASKGLKNMETSLRTADNSGEILTRHHPKTVQYTTNTVTLASFTNGKERGLKVGVRGTGLLIPW
jgi:hypothetical protein